MKLVAIVSTNNNEEECTDIIDKDNGNITVASDVDENYIDIFLAIPIMIDSINDLKNALDLSKKTIEVYHRSLIGK